MELLHWRVSDYDLACGIDYRNVRSSRQGNIITCPECKKTYDAARNRGKQLEEYGKKASKVVKGPAPGC